MLLLNMEHKRSCCSSNNNDDNIVIKVSPIIVSYHDYLGVFLGKDKGRHLLISGTFHHENMEKFVLGYNCLSVPLLSS